MELEGTFAGSGAAVELRHDIGQFQLVPAPEEIRLDLFEVEAPPMKGPAHDGESHVSWVMALQPKHAVQEDPRRASEHIRLDRPRRDGADGAGHRLRRQGAVDVREIHPVARQVDAQHPGAGDAVALMNLEVANRDKPVRVFDGGLQKLRPLAPKFELGSSHLRTNINQLICPPAPANGAFDVRRGVVGKGVKDPQLVPIEQRLERVRIDVGSNLPDIIPGTLIAVIGSDRATLGADQGEIGQAPDGVGEMKIGQGFRPLNAPVGRVFHVELTRDAEAGNDFLPPVRFKFPPVRPPQLARHLGVRRVLPLIRRQPLAKAFGEHRVQAMEVKRHVGGRLNLPRGHIDRRRELGVAAVQPAAHFAELKFRCLPFTSELE